MSKELKRKILKATFEILATPADLVLFTLLATVEMGGGDYRFSTIQRKLDGLISKGQDRIIRDAIYRARKENWIRKDFKLTEEGKKRIKNLLPQYIPPRSWNGRWYLVSFDIPEKMRFKRDILRENLKRLGFRPMHASCWISAINYLPTVQELIDYYRLRSCVILAETERLGQEDSKTLANRIWRLDKINSEYKKFIPEWEKSSSQDKFLLQFKYLSILRKDPQLPKELLPDDWLGFKAYQLYKKLNQKDDEKKKLKIRKN